MNMINTVGTDYTCHRSIFMVRSRSKSIYLGTFGHRPKHKYSSVAKWSNPFPQNRI